MMRSDLRRLRDSVSSLAVDLDQEDLLEGEGFLEAADAAPEDVERLDHLSPMRFSSISHPHMEGSQLVTPEFLLQCFMEGRYLEVIESRGVDHWPLSQEQLLTLSQETRDSLLQAACFYSKYNIMTDLLEAKADPEWINRDEFNAFDVAAMLNDHKALNLLFERSASDPYDPMQLLLEINSRIEDVYDWRDMAKTNLFQLLFDERDYAGISSALSCFGNKLICDVTNEELSAIPPESLDELLRNACKFQHYNLMRKLLIAGADPKKDCYSESPFTLETGNVYDIAAVHNDLAALDILFANHQLSRENSSALLVQVNDILVEQGRPPYQCNFNIREAALSPMASCGSAVGREMFGGSSFQSI